MDASVSETNRLYGKTFSFMALATLTSLIVGYLVIRFVPAIMLIFTNWIGALVWLGVSIGALRLAYNMTADGAGSAVAGVFIVGALYGVFLAPILALYSINAIIAGFGSGTLLFLVLFAFGKSTKYDLSRMGTQLRAALIALIIVSLFSFFLHASIVFIVIDALSILIFMGFVMYDSQQIGRAFRSIDVSDDSEVTAVTAQAAISLYVDFITLVINLIELFGDVNN